MTVWLHPQPAAFTLWHVKYECAADRQLSGWHLIFGWTIWTIKCKTNEVYLLHSFFFRKNFRIQVFHFVIPLQTTCWFLHETSLNLISGQRTAVIKRAWCACAPFVYVLKCCFNSGCYWQEDLQPWRRLWMTHGVGGVTPHCSCAAKKSFSALRLCFVFSSVLCVIN